jgi:hypothetical protein
MYVFSMTMIRKQFFIDRDASARLKRAAAARGVSEAALIREGIAHVVDQAEGADWKVKLEAALKAITPGQFDDLAERVEENRRQRKVRMKARRERLQKQWTDGGA